MAEILVVDDTAFMRLAFKNLIEPMGHTIIECGDGKDAIELYKANHPTLVIMDITMPDMDGITALKEIKKIDKDAKVMMCSALGQEQRIVQAIEAGALTFVVKPFDNDKFVATVKGLLER